MPVPVSTTYSTDNDMKLFDDTYTDFASADRDQARTRAYSLCNSVLVNKVPVPVRRNKDNDYDGFIKNMESLYSLSYLYAGQSRDKSVAFREDADMIRDAFLDGKYLLEEQNSASEIGVQQAVANANNSGSGQIIADTRAEYTDTRRRTYTLTVTTGGAVGTAVYSYQSDLDTSATTGKVSSDDYTSIGDGLRIYFAGNESGSFVTGDKWYITCVPETEERTGKKTRSISLIKCG